MKKVKRLRSANWLLENSHADVKYGIENIVNNIFALAGVAQWIEHWPANQRVAGSNPS